MVRGWIRRGEIPAVRAGKNYLVVQADIDARLTPRLRASAPRKTLGVDVAAPAGGPMLTKRQRQKVASEIISLIGPGTSDAEARTLRFAAHQIGRQTEEEVRFCRTNPRGRP